MQERGGPRPVDVATRGLIEADPAGWLRWLELPVDGPVQAIDSDVTAVLAEVDKVLRVDGPAPWLAHVEFQVSSDPFLARRLLQYYALLLHRHGLPVATTVVLLRRQAYSRGLNGRFEQRGPLGEVTVSFNYRVVRLWEQPVDQLLGGSLGVLPLAPLAAVEPGRLPEIITVLDERFQREAPSQTAIDELWGATLLLMGMRYDATEAMYLLRGVTKMRESTTYQMILEEGVQQGVEQGLERGREEGEQRGRLREARELVLDLGSEKLGSPDTVIEATIQATDDLVTLHRMARAVLRAESWHDLIATSQS